MSTPLRTRAARVVAAAAATSLLLPAAVAVAGPRPGPATEHHGGTHLAATLAGRATLSADYLADGPPSGAAASPGNGRQGPWDGQVIPGFSAMVDNHDGTFWAQPDNGFGAKGNSADFLLRNYLVRPQWDTGRGKPSGKHSGKGNGEIKVLDFVEYNDRDHVLDFDIVNEDTTDRLLTGADFDVESLVRAADGTFWVGEEFGPFLLHFDADGTLLEAPYGFPDGKSPGNPYLEPGETPNVGSSRGFEAMAGSGRYLYPVVEGALADDADPRRRWIYQFDTRRGEYTGKRWAYQTDQTANVIGDAFSTGRDSMLLIERDDFEGDQSVTKRVYEIDLGRTDRDGFVRKELVVDALRIDNPRGIDAGEGYGLGETFALPVQSFETVLFVDKDTLLIGNDNNYPGNDARVTGTPDDTEMALVDLRKKRVADDGVTVVGHRGASGYRPEHTLAAYETAINQCADYIEPDVVSTKDGVLVARHENEISGTTDVATHAEFAGRRTTKTIDGARITGWFTEDFTLAELRTLRAKERLPQVRPQNTAFDGLYLIPTLDEVLDLARNSRTCDGAPVGVYPETKHPTYFDSVGLSLEEPLVAELRRNGFDRRDAPVIVQSFEVGNLQELDELTDVPLGQLISSSGAPYDLVADGDPRTYADLVTRQGLREIATYADGIGSEKNVLIPRNADGTLAAPSSVIRDAHRAGLDVHAWTFRRENQFLAAEFRSSADPNGIGDLVGEIEVFLDAGLDGFFSDNPDLGDAAVS
ncbi:esterase-like activity of phytase family protein [Promicromonospora sukumoe]|uniref:glycerophosphodiester phosphodiesterase n=1 Tax=Promicromonospora sukumoe TaxID=88382 RepID=A0A7W3PC42_9MICO|nr:esterase-like activity of phytase family protein [Promicromonospora sukumoe]MBA8806338.1 glycerophosphoryl diester phosphodiesterase [Promicromonospora sukumoe]